MKKHIRKFLAIILCITCGMGAIGCADTTTPSEPSAQASLPEEESSVPETTQPVTTTAGEGMVSLDGKRVIFIGNSYVFYGRSVLNKSASAMTQAERENDQGFFYQLCKANGMEVNVTNWTFGGHGLMHFFGAPCSHSSSACKGTRHEDALVNPYYDYVFVSPGGGSSSADSIAEDFDYLINFFREANPDVKIICLGNLGCHGYSSFGADLPGIYNYYATLADKGVIIADWGGLVYRLMHGQTTVPGGTQSYSENSFIVKDGYHPNMLSGYITTLMAYCAVTGESAVGQPYAFCNNSQLNVSFDFSGYVRTYYTSSFTTNFPEIFGSEADMRGIQELVDQFLAGEMYLTPPEKKQADTGASSLTQHPTNPVISVVFSGEKMDGNGWMPSASKWNLSTTDGYQYFSGLRGDADAIASLAGTTVPGGLTEEQKQDLADIRYGLSVIGLSHMGLTEYAIRPEGGGEMYTSSLLNLCNGHYGSTHYANLHFDDMTYNINGEVDANSPYTALITLNFGSVRTFEAIGYSSGDLKGFPQAQDVYVSDDGVNWVQVPSACYDTNDAPVASVSGKSATRDPINNNEPKVLVLFDMANYTGKYIRIGVRRAISLEKNYINTRELLVYGK